MNKNVFNTENSICPFHVCNKKFYLIKETFAKLPKASMKNVLCEELLHNLGYPKNSHDRFHIITKVPLMTIR